MENAFIFFLIAAVIIGTIISSISKMSAAKEKQNNQQTRTNPSAPIASRGVNPINKQKDDFRAEADKTALKKESDYNIKHNQPSSMSTTSADAKHTHPSAQRKVRVEKAYVESSMDSHLSEGCSDHYYDRFVAINEDTKKAKTLTELEKIIVIGEVLNNPGYKKYRS